MIEKFGITSFFAPPTVWIALLALTADGCGQTLRKLAKGYYGASIMPVEVLKELASRLPQGAACGTCTAKPKSRRWPPLLGPEDQLRKLGSCGKCGVATSKRAW